ncbi:Hypothetical protein PAS_chr1-4_0026 [Komagataella phaffii GS115]|uniref:HTH CENPB-type domain-containing protein n=2 Tax=Komagataella phaffii TaxID=460519 RepID=C4QX87_KOMPG|nr:Hypothetical protein PAS_chr1-4_0026 [Komagataella phaffii GS115]AOA61815.1 GQ67_02163T0 [Komagataella phaffii]AOA65411.1 GQ68_02178T0 [Komagataella phaffii GS115]CAY67860.1 Hypothetical protein PAS_chr1-4_0026 [Komagataella phaffii GS115]
MSEPSSKLPRANLEEKIMIINHFHSSKRPQSETVEYFKEKFAISTSSLSEWLKKETELRERYDQSQKVNSLNGVHLRHAKRKVKFKYEKINAAMDQLVETRLSTNQPINETVLRKYWIQYAKAFGVDNPKRLNGFSHGWLCHFKKRHGLDRKSLQYLKHRESPGSGDSVNASGTNESNSMVSQGHIGNSSVRTGAVGGSAGLDQERLFIHGVSHGEDRFSLPQFLTSSSTAAGVTGSSSFPYLPLDNNTTSSSNAGTAATVSGATVSSGPVNNNTSLPNSNSSLYGTVHTPGLNFMTSQPPSQQSQQTQQPSQNTSQGHQQPQLQQQHSSQQHQQPYQSSDPSYMNISVSDMERFIFMYADKFFIENCGTFPKTKEFFEQFKTKFLEERIMLSQRNLNSSVDEFFLTNGSKQSSYMFNRVNR